MIKFRTKKILLMICFFLTSCGLKITNEIGENVLLGSWTLDYVACYNSESETTIYEQYDFLDNNHDVVIEFEGGRFEYEVSTDCTTTAYGSYSTDFDGDSKGHVDFSDITSGSTCDVSISDTGPDTVGSTDVAMAILPSKSDDLYWLVDDSVLELELGTGFQGSSQSPGCQGLCFCKGFFNKD